MTILEPNYRKCAVCGNVSMHHELISTHYYLEEPAWSDLDFRPPRTDEDDYSWEDVEYQSCFKCKYIAKDIEEDTSDEVKAFVLSDEYKKLNPDAPAGKYKALMALSFLKKDYTSALSAARHLIWLYEDHIRSLDAAIRVSIDNKIFLKTLDYTKEVLKEEEKNLQFYLHKAIEILETYKDELTLDFDVITCLIADYHRRTGNFDKVIEFCSKNGSADENIREILRFEVYLASQNDSACYNVGQAKKYCAKHQDENIVPKTGKTWTCAVCGAEGLTSRCCPECGSERWMCSECAQWNAGDVCESCQAPKPAEIVKKSWSCSKCRHSGNDGKVCRHCGAPKPELQTWECPYCHQKENTAEECPKCGFSYWDIHDPVAIDFYDTMLMGKRLAEQEKKRG